MTERERLVELICKANDKYPTIPLVNGCRESVMDFLSDYLLANGVIVPPCKVGDTVYRVMGDKRIKQPYEYKVVGFWYSADETCNDVHLVRYVNDVFAHSISVPLYEFGKIVFLSREEAEESLRKERNNER